MTAMKHAVTHHHHVEKFLNRGTSLWVQGNEKYGTNSGAVTWWIGLDDMSKEEILEGSVVSVLFPIHVAAVSHLCQLWHKWETATWAIISHAWRVYLVVIFSSSDRAKPFITVAWASNAAEACETCCNCHQNTDTKI